MSTKYMSVCAVKHGADNDLIDCGITEHNVTDGDFVILENGTRGTVTAVAFMDVSGSDFSLLSNYTDINEITSIYHCTWSKEENNV